MSVVVLFVLVAVFIVISIYQLCLIFIAVRPFIFSRAQVELKSISPVEDGPERIARIIHQVWKSQNISTYPAIASREYWISECGGDWIVKLWDDEKILDLIKRDYNWILSLYLSYAFDIQRADIARLIILHSEGGLYSDLDAFPRPGSGLRIISRGLLQHDAVIFRSTDGFIATNHLILAQKGSPLLMHALKSAKYYNVPICLPYLRVFYSTGPIFFHFVVQDYLSTCKIGNCDILRLAGHHAEEIALHRAGRSWLSADGVFFNWLGDNHLVLPFIQLCVLIVLLILMGLIALRCRTMHQEKSMRKH